MIRSLPPRAGELLASACQPGLIILGSRIQSRWRRGPSVRGAGSEPITAVQLTKPRDLKRRAGRQGEHKRARIAQACAHQNHAPGACKSLHRLSRVPPRRASPYRVTAAITADTECKFPRGSHRYDAPIQVSDSSRSLVVTQQLGRDD
jgi:hypothetical protein